MIKILSSSFLLLLATLGLAQAQPESFDLASPDQKYAAVYAPMEETPFRITEKGTQKPPVATLDDEHAGNRGLTAAWSPDSRTLVVLVEFRLETKLEIFRLREGRFEHADGPNPPEQLLTLGRWVAPDKVQLKGEKKTYTLTVTGSAAKFGG